MRVAAMSILAELASQLTSWPAVSRPEVAQSEVADASTLARINRTLRRASN